MSDDPSVTTVAPRPSGLRALFRVGVVGLLAAYIWLGPMPKQVFGKGHDALRTWQMFSGSGLESTEVRFYRMEGDKRIPLSREELTAAGIRPPARGQETDEKAAVATARHMCRALGPGADVRYTIRKAKRSGWGKREGGDTNRCPSAAPRPVLDVTALEPADEESP